MFVLFLIHLFHAELKSVWHQPFNNSIFQISTYNTESYGESSLILRYGHFHKCAPFMLATSIPKAHPPCLALWGDTGHTAIRQADVLLAILREWGAQTTIQQVKEKSLRLCKCHSVQNNRQMIKKWSPTSAGAWEAQEQLQTGGSGKASRQEKHTKAYLHTESITWRATMWKYELTEWVS